MEPLQTINILTLKAVTGDDNHDGLCDKNYFIPSYQRGYRWGAQQVEQLVKDLTEYFNGDNNGDFYCLQPIVVKKITDYNKKISLGLSKPDEPWYEVIDGQQRLTTILIILTLENLMDDDADFSFSIHYETRPDLGNLFGKLILEKSDKEDKKLCVRVSSQSSRLDIDSYHILKASQRVLDFFQNEEIPGAHKKYFKGTFYENFTRRIDVSGKSVQVIWYELCDEDSSSAVELFKRLNDKSIKLNNAELIRALFLSESAKYELTEDLPKGLSKNLKEIIIARERESKQQHLIAQWDMIETRLHDSQFWNFIHKDGDKADYNCRIEYLFDLIAHKDDDDRDSLTTLLKFQELSANGTDGLWELWQKVELYYAILQAWSLDRDKYHKIGFIVSQEGTHALIDLLKQATSLSKPDFNNMVDERISKLLDINAERLGKLQYGKNDNNAIERILLFFNVEFTRLSVNEPFFPFEKYKSEDWSLEHIHAQNSELIDASDKEKWIEFIRENIKALRKMQLRFKDTDLDPESLIETLKSNYDRAKDKNDKRFSFSIVQKLYSEIATYFDKFAQNDGLSPDLHSISNLALLSGKINTAIGNSVFEVKRQAIVELDAKGEYIPLCTRKAFLKYYNKDEEGFETAQLFYWGKRDQDNYYNSIIKTIEPYFIKDMKDSEEKDTVEIYHTQEN